MMDLIVCGGVDPYRQLLTGKLTALMMLSPQVRRDYSKRYADSPSEIASRMGGTEITRKAELVFIGTTSLYGVGSAQYNRLSLPGTIQPGGKAAVRYEALGTTLGFGSVQFSPTTRQNFDAVIRDAQSYQPVRNRFGEGVSPNMRLTRQGLSELGLDDEALLQHRSPRLVYGARLATNAYEYLRTEQTRPSYSLPSAGSDQAGRLASEAIADYWRTRWLRSRLEFPAALERIRSMADRQSPVGVGDD
jgi:hypothetical protein